jgi:hypothetical protein
LTEIVCVECRSRAARRRACAVSVRDGDAKLCVVAQAPISRARGHSRADLHQPDLSVWADDEIVESNAAQGDADRVQRRQLLPGSDKDRLVDLGSRQLS